MTRLPAALLGILVFSPLLSAAEFELRDGDRVVLLGSTLIEREQRYGYWETALTARHPDRNVTFRNLGWSGDTVWGEARAGFDSPAEGYKRLVSHALALKPTVLFIAYGTNESFAGQEGLARFQKQLDRLLDDLAPSKARVVLLAPPLVDRRRRTGGKPDERDRDLKLYTSAIQQTAERRQACFVKEFCQSYRPASPLTDNGMHLTAYGYWWAAPGLLNELKLTAALKQQPVELTGQKPVRVRQDFLPNPPAPSEPGVTDTQADSIVRGRDLKPGKWTLTIDGQAVHTGDAGAWLKPESSGVVLMPRGPSLEQAEKLRQAIVAKNREYFYRWRPQNETYLFGFRKHEQGQNAAEVPLFDPLVEKAEKEIAKLRVPTEHTYELIPEKKEGGR